MQHLDEGTIHAWLDGALAPNEASAAEAHVQACEQCARAVAEARGLIAASTRILGALDDVPAMQTVADGTLTLPMARRRRGSWWRRAGVGYAAAATMLLAVGTTLVWRVTSPNAALDRPVVGLDEAAPAALPQASQQFADSVQSGRGSTAAPAGTAASGVANEKAASSANVVRSKNTNAPVAQKEELAIDRIVPLPGAMPRPAAPAATPPPSVRQEAERKLAFAKAEDADRGAVVQGRVVDAATGVPVNGAVVSVDTTKAVARTDSTGKFQLQSVPSGQQTVRVRAMGFQPAQHQLAVAPHDSVDLGFALQKSTMLLQEVVTTGAAQTATERQRAQVGGLRDTVFRREQLRSAELPLDEIRANSAGILGCYTLRSTSDQARDARKDAANVLIPKRVELDSRAQERAQREDPIVNRVLTLEGPGRAESWRFVGDSLELALLDGTKRVTLRFVRSGNRWISPTAVMEPCATR